MFITCSDFFLGFADGIAYFGSREMIQLKAGPAIINIDGTFGLVPSSLRGSCRQLLTFLAAVGPERHVSNLNIIEQNYE